ncbi:F-box/FBD/LRR-repeat protein At1g13570-like isoform X2 [Bidens hawaiensis]|uniref:F-box/FBD/LRR-repeat protein At1g13570-like isoform X2 n=1 Tax=Bidens hawaiensis TaxID=980011 RepID=UPI00404A75C8
MKIKRLCEAERLPSDRISTLPQPVIETILSLLPTTEEAARTSILSREWRYKWTTIPKLELSHMDWLISEQVSETTCRYCYYIHKVLLLYQGPIHELAFTTPGNNCLELDQIILRLSRNHPVKKLSLTTYGRNLPMSVSSFRNVTDLEICGLHLDDTPLILNGFDSLRRLSLIDVGISTKTLLHVLSNNPSLGSFSMCRIGGFDPDDKCTIIELFECLPMIERLATWAHVSQWVVMHSVPQKLPTSLIHLKYFCFEEMCFENGNDLYFLLVLIKCSPNLEKIELQNYWQHLCNEEYSVVWEDYSDVWLEHLNELQIDHFTNYEPEMEFVKFILARSPKLKKVSLLSDVNSNRELKMLKTLLEAPRVSPVVITVSDSHYKDL